MRRALNNRIAVVALTVALGCVQARAGGAVVPDWVRQAAAQPLGNYAAETNAVVLLDQTDYTVTAPGEVIEHSRHVVKILRPEGREEGDLYVEVGQGEKLHYARAWSMDRGGREYEIRQGDFTEKSFPTYELYSDVHYMVAKAAAPDPGSVIAFEYEVQRHSYVNQINLTFQEPDPVREVRVGLTLPTGWEFKDSWPAAAAVEPAQTAPNHYEWSAHDLPGLQKEPMMPHESALLGRLSIAYFPAGGGSNMGSWAALGNWYQWLAKNRRDVTPEITQRVQQLVAGKTDFDSKLHTLAAFLQSEIRYVAIEIGVGGYQPHFARDIFRYRYGDCKDKATLLSTMLEVAGVHSSYVLIDTNRGFVNPAVPSVWFNHAILAIELPDEVKSDSYSSVVTAKSGKRYLIFDPTDEYTPVGSLRSELQDSYALLVGDSGGEMIRTPLLPPDWNIVTRTGRFVLTDDGGLSGEVFEDRSGDFAMEERESLHYRDQRERDQDFQRWMGRSLQGFTLEAFKVEQADQIAKDLLTDYRFSTPQYGQTRGPLMLVRARVLGGEEHLVEHKPRHYPVELGYTARETDTYEIEIPRDYQVDDIPEPVKLDVGFASYESKTEVKGSKLTYWRQYVVRDISVPPEKFADWAKLQGVIGADEAAAVVLKRAP